VRLVTRGYTTRSILRKNSEHQTKTDSQMGGRVEGGDRGEGVNHQAELTLRNEAFQ